MKRTIHPIHLLAIALLLTIPSGVAAQVDAPAAFERMKAALKGDWEGRLIELDSPVEATFYLTGNESALVEDIRRPDKPASRMHTVYHLADEELRLTHYCSLRNQPRLVATDIRDDGRTIAFELVDVTNLSRSGNRYTHKMVVSFLDDDHVSIVYVGVNEGHEGILTAKLTRVRATDSESALSADPTETGAKIFQPGVFSTGREFGVTFSPDGSTIYFTRSSDIYWAEKEHGAWSAPKPAGFSDGAWARHYMTPGEDVEYFNWDPVISPDGSRLFIMSHGLVDGRIVAGKDGDYDLWSLPRTAAGFSDDAWGEPEHLGSAVNTPLTKEGAAGVAPNGDLYFFSTDRRGGMGRADIYVAPNEDGRYNLAAPLGTPVNSELWEGHTYVDPIAGRYLLYIVVDRAGSYGDCDIFVSVRTAGAWGEPVNLGPNVNTEACELTPSLTPDGKTLFFARIEDGDREANVRNIYFIGVEDTVLAKFL